MLSESPFSFKVCDVFKCDPGSLSDGVERLNIDSRAGLAPWFMVCSVGREEPRNKVDIHLPGRDDIEVDKDWWEGDLIKCPRASFSLSSSSMGGGETVTW